MDPSLAGAAYRDSSLSPEKRSADLLARMTREEKIAQLCSVWLTLDPASGDFAPFQGMFMKTPIDQRELLRHGIGQITRPFGSRPVAPSDGAHALNAFQRYLIENTRLGDSGDRARRGAQRLHGRRRHAVPVAAQLRRHLGPRVDPPRGGRHSPPDARGRHAPGARAGGRRGARRALGPRRGVRRRGRLPGRHDRVRVRRGTAGRRPARRRSRHVEALLRLLGQRGRPQLRAVARRSARVRRRVPAAVRDGGEDGRCEVGDERLHRRRRRALRRLARAAHRDPARALGLRRRRRCRLLRGAHAAPAPSRDGGACRVGRGSAARRARRRTAHLGVLRAGTRRSARPRPARSRHARRSGARACCA